MREFGSIEVNGKLSLSFLVVEVEGSCDGFGHAQLLPPG